MQYAIGILGTTAVETLKKTAGDAVLQIGSDRLTRGDLARVGCYNFVAARILSDVLHRELRVKNLQEVYDKIPPSALALPRLGAISLAVLGAAFEARGIGGDNPLESYVEAHLTEGQRVTTFHTIKQAKHREQQEIAQERAAKKRRKAARQHLAHELRVDRELRKAQT